MEREGTPQVLMKLGIQLYLARLSLLNTVFVLDIFGVNRARFTVHDWVHKADLQPESDQNPDHVAVDETVIQLNGEQYWLYAAVDLETNGLLYTRPEPPTNSVISQTFFATLREKHDVSAAVFLINGSHSLKDACRRHGLDFRYENMEIGVASSVSFERYNDELYVFQTVSATPNQKLLMIGSDRSASHGIS